VSEDRPADGTDSPGKAKARGPQPEWAKLPDGELLKLRIKDLGLSLEGSGLAGKIGQLYRELDLKGVWFHPPCYLSAEWACPDEVPAIGIAFYLAHPRLRRLENRMMLEVEGGTHDEFMRILRHECGHALNYAFLLHRKKRWRELFGPFDAEYKEVYRVRPYSRRYVRNLENCYAQMHPDEDFAETFAVWLQPRHNWHREYAGWKAMDKLEYVDELMRKEVIARPPKVTAKKRQYLWQVSRLTTTLEAHYRRRRSAYAHEYNDYYDRELRQLFREGPDAAGAMAAEFLKRRRRQLVDLVSKWSRESKYNINELLDTVVERCGDLDLRVAGAEEDEMLEVAAYLTSLSVNYKYTGEFRRKR
jgi:hypothetical protein